MMEDDLDMIENYPNLLISDSILLPYIFLTDTDSVFFPEYFYLDCTSMVNGDTVSSLYCLVFDIGQLCPSGVSKADPPTELPNFTQ